MTSASRRQQGPWWVHRSRRLQHWPSNDQLGHASIESTERTHGHLEREQRTSWVNLRLAPAGKKARLTLEHVAHKGGIGEEHLKQFGPGAVGIGWELGLLGLGMHVRSKEARDSFNEHVWGASDEGKDFVGKSGEGWIAADIKGGENAAEATRRGKSTISFYRGEPPPGAVHPGTTGS